VRPDIGVVEISLSGLQKVGDELVATSGYRSFSSARIGSRRQAFLVRDERNLIRPTWQMKVLRLNT
jgi:hypothetical protein